MALEVGLAEYSKDKPGRIVLLGTTQDRAIVRLVVRHLHGEIYSGRTPEETVGEPAVPDPRHLAIAARTRRVRADLRAIRPDNDGEAVQ